MILRGSCTKDGDHGWDGEDMESITNLRPENYENSMDLRGIPTHVCACGCNIFNLKVIFEDCEIATYFLDMECAHCGSLATAPTPELL